MRGSAGGLEKLSAGVSGLVKKTLDCTVLHHIQDLDSERQRRGRLRLNVLSVIFSSHLHEHMCNSIFTSIIWLLECKFLYSWYPIIYIIKQLNISFPVIQ